MSKIERECLTKTERKVLHLIMKNTLHKNTPIKREKRSFKMSNEEMALNLNCNERTIQRAIKRFSALALIKRNTPPKKFLRGAHYISISDSFYERTKDFFEAEKNVTHKEKNVGPIKINISKTISLSLNNLSKKTNTNINREKVEFFISDEILEIDLKGLDKKIELTHQDLQIIQNKAKWSVNDIQESIDNFSIALETGLFIPTKTTAKIAFIAILSGTNKRMPSKFNKIVAPKKETTKTIEPSRNDDLILTNKKENYWISLTDLRKQEFLKESSDNLQIAMINAYSSYIQNDFEFSLSAILNDSFNFYEPKNRNSNNSKIKFKLEQN